MLSYSTQDVREMLNARSRADMPALDAIAQIEARLPAYMSGQRGDKSVARRHAESSAARAGLKIGEISAHQLGAVFSMDSLAR